MMTYQEVKELLKKDPVVFQGIQNSLELTVGCAYAVRWLAEKGKQRHKDYTYVGLVQAVSEIRQDQENV